MQHMSPVAYTLRTAVHDSIEKILTELFLKKKLIMLFQWLIIIKETQDI